MVHYHGPRSKGTNQGKSSVGRARPKMGVRGQLQVSSRTARPTSIVAMVYRAPRLARWAATLQVC